MMPLGKAAMLWQREAIGRPFARADRVKIIEGANPGRLVRASHREWYRELFQPCVAAGVFAPGVLAGHRSETVDLRTSRYVPSRWEAVRDAGGSVRLARRAAFRFPASQTGGWFAF
jgi:hypothetical protein